ncbi:MAG: hypothetical protein M0R30_08550 [Methanoregula sp.]|jgi:hypothetical protein|uniref:hypothetical protein n=1 Tax=Methanoregula sp. TaxID=2052170 RepID=UPI0025F13AA6|nr:hypothetical protein [Methanoregula sp.]MCK9631682.1 hypothetical protein [Methanoregula sp.]
MESNNKKEKFRPEFEGKWWRLGTPNIICEGTLKHDGKSTILKVNGDLVKNAVPCSYIGDIWGTTALGGTAILQNCLIQNSNYDPDGLLTQTFAVGDVYVNENNIITLIKK